MQTNPCSTLPSLFVDLAEIIPDIQLMICYASAHNFIGRPIDGYLAQRALLTRPAAEQLAKVQQRLRPRGLTLKIFDAYRPERAVRDFVRWSQDETDQRNKAHYYPNIDKAQIVAQGYVAEYSSHCRGSTVDLTIAVAASSYQAPGPALANGELDMGSVFDWFGLESHADFLRLSAGQLANRRWLHALMGDSGFINLPQEWWHFTLCHEPYPNQSFDIPIV